MKLSRFLLIMGMVTLFSLLYVYQQTEIMRFAYVGQKRVTVFDDLLDKNSVLRYNINKSASLVHIGGLILNRTDLQMPDNFQLVRLAPLKQNLKVNAQAFNNKENVISRLFGIKRQAEARTVNP